MLYLFQKKKKKNFDNANFKSVRLLPFERRYSLKTTLFVILENDSKNNVILRKLIVLFKQQWIE